MEAYSNNGNIFQDEDINQHQSRDTDDVRLPGASSQATGSILTTSPVSTRETAYVSPIQTMPVVKFTHASSNMPAINASPGASQQVRYRKSSEVPDASLPGSSNAENSNSAEPPAKKAKTENRTGSTAACYDDECTICLVRSSNSGEHRLVALKCGHVFGHSCVKNWLKSKPVKDRKCPSCQAKANFRDLRFLYARRLVAADTSQIELLKRQLDTTKVEINRIHTSEVQALKRQLDTTKEEKNHNASEVKALKRQLDTTNDDKNCIESEIEALKQQLDTTKEELQHNASEIEALKLQLDTTKDEKNHIELELQQAQLAAKSNDNLCNVM